MLDTKEKINKDRTIGLKILIFTLQFQHNTVFRAAKVVFTHAFVPIKQEAIL